jgi:hypothetical protein
MLRADCVNHTIILEQPALVESCRALLNKLHEDGLFIKKALCIFSFYGIIDSYKQPPPMSSCNRSEYTDLVRLATIVEKLQFHDRSGMDALNTMFAPGIRCVLARRVAPNDIEPALIKVLARVADVAGCRKELNPDQLPALVLSCVREVCGSQTESRVDAMRQILDRLSSSESEALWRYYRLEQTPSEVHRETDLPEVALSALKSRVKNSFFLALQPRPGSVQNVLKATVTAETAS